MGGSVDKPLIVDSIIKLANSIKETKVENWFIDERIALAKKHKTTVADVTTRVSNRLKRSVKRTQYLQIYYRAPFLEL